MVEAKPEERKEFCARLRLARISARKMRYVSSLIRGQNVNRALEVLQVTPNRGAYFLRKLLRSALANANHLDDKVDVDALYISKLWVNEGVMMKRFRPMTRGRAGLIRKRFCHVNLFLALPSMEQVKKGRRGSSRVNPKGETLQKEKSK